MTSFLFLKRIVFILLGVVFTCYAGKPVVVINQKESGQKPGSKMVDIIYTLYDEDGDDLDVSLIVTGTNGFLREV